MREASPDGPAGPSSDIPRHESGDTPLLYKIPAHQGEKDIPWPISVFQQLSVRFPLFNLNQYRHTKQVHPPRYLILLVIRYLSIVPTMGVFLNGNTMFKKFDEMKKLFAASIILVLSYLIIAGNPDSYNTG